ARMERMAASPGRARMLLQIAFEIDVRDVLPSVRVPTLVLHREGDPISSVEGARDMAARIPAARMVALPGSDHIPFIGDTEPLLAEIERFVTGSCAGARHRPVIARALC